MRYFISTVATRPVVVGDRTFNFEPMALRGGQWFGVLALDEPDASILSACGLPQIGEISEERFLDEKKKENPQQHFSSESRIPVPTYVEGLQVAGVAAAPTTVAHSESAGTLHSETLQTTTLSPPGDPLLEDRSDRTRFNKFK